MSPNGRMMKNHSKKWCALEPIIQHGIVNYLLIHMFQRSIENLFLFVELCQKGLKSVNMKMTMFVFIVELGFSMMAIIVGYEAQLTAFPWSIEPNTQLAPFVAFWISYSCDLSPLSCLLNCNSLEATQAEMLKFKFDFDFI